MGSSIVTIIIAIGLIMFSLYKTFKLIQQILKKSKSETWQVTSAEVVSKDVIKKISTRSGSSFFPEIGYRYTVMGHSYENTVRLQKNYTRRKAEEKLAEIGMTLEVRYNPNQPKEHVSECEFINYVEIVMILISLVLAGIMLYPYLLN